MERDVARHRPADGNAFAHPAVLRASADEHSGGHVRIVGEPVRAGRGDARALDDATATHPVLVENGPGADPGRIVACDEPLTTPGDAVEFRITAAALGEIRRWATSAAARDGMDEDRRADVALVVTELATNSLEHGTGDPRLHGWHTGTELVLQTVNRGRLSDPLAGRRPVPADSPRGRGLLLVNLMADLVRVHTTCDRTTVRATFRRTAQGRARPVAMRQVVPSA